MTVYLHDNGILGLQSAFFWKRYFYRLYREFVNFHVHAYFVYVSAGV